MQTKTIEVIPIRQPTQQTRVAAYIRVSTGSVEQETSFMFQKEYWEQKLSSMPNHINVGLYSDEGITGYSAYKRAGLMKMVEDAMQGKIDIIYTKSISRFSRNLKDLVGIIQKLSSVNIPIIFEKEELNSLDPQANLLIKLQGILSEQEVKNNKFLVEQSRRRQFEEGIPYMCRMPYGFKQECYPNFVINEEEAENIKSMFQLYVEGWSVKDIVKIFKQNGVLTKTGKAVWPCGTIIRMLRNEKYVGDVLLQKTYRDENLKTHRNKGEVKQFYIENNHTPIIDRETYDKVQLLFQLRAKGERKTHTPREAPFKYGFIGKLVCGKCGKKYRHKKRYLGQMYEFQGYWLCTTEFQLGKEYCDNRTLYDDVLHRITLSAYQEYFNEADKTITRLESRVKEIVKEQMSLTSLVMKRYINKDAYEKELEKLQDEFSQHDKTIRAVNGKKAKYYEKFDMELLEHVEKIEVHGNTLKYHFINGKIIQKEYISNAE